MFCGDDGGNYWCFVLLFACGGDGCWWMVLKVVEMG